MSVYMVILLSECNSSQWMWLCYNTNCEPCLQNRGSWMWQTCILNPDPKLIILKTLVVVFLPLKMKYVYLSQIFIVRRKWKKKVQKFPTLFLVHSKCLKCLPLKIDSVDPAKTLALSWCSSAIYLMSWKWGRNIIKTHKWNLWLN